MHPLGEALVATEQLVLRLLGRRLLHLLDEQVILDPLPPVVLGLGLALGPGRGFAVDDDRLLLGEVLRAVEHFFDQRQPRIETFEKAVEDLVGKAHIASLDEVVERIPLLHEAVDVALQEVQLPRVEPLQEDCEPSLGDIVVDRVPQEVFPLEVAADGEGDLPVVGPGLGTRGGGGGAAGSGRPNGCGRLFTATGHDEGAQQTGREHRRQLPAGAGGTIAAHVD